MHGGLVIESWSQMQERNRRAVSLAAMWDRADPANDRYRYRVRYRYRNITALPVCPVCGRRLSACPACLRATHRQAQAGTGRRANGTGREHEIQNSRLAASFRKTSGPTNWERIDSDPDSDSDSEKNGCRQEIYGANLAKGCLPCQTQRIARLSFRGFSSTARTRRPV